MYKITEKVALYQMSYGRRSIVACRAFPATSIIIPQAGAVVNTQSAFFATLGAKDRHSALHRAICNFRHLCITSSDVR